MRAEQVGDPLNINSASIYGSGRIGGGQQTVGGVYQRNGFCDASSALPRDAQDPHLSPTQLAEFLCTIVESSADTEAPVRPVNDLHLSRRPQVLREEPVAEEVSFAVYAAPAVRLH